MLLVEYLSFLAGICLQSFRGFVLGVSVIRHFRCGLVGGRELALAVPAVSGPVFVPEGIVHGAHRPPEHAVVGAGVWGCGRQPFEVGQHVLLLFELPPACGKMGAVNGRVVLGAQPCLVAVARIRNVSASSPPCLWTRTDEEIKAIKDKWEERNHLEFQEVVLRAGKYGIDYHQVHNLSKFLNDKEIIERIGGGDLTIKR